MFRRRMYRRRRRMRVPRNVGNGGAITLRRSSQPTKATLATGGIGLQILPNLNQVVTSDIISVFREYRLLGVTIQVSLREDPGNSAAGAAANAARLQIAFANDPEGPAAPTAYNQVTAYANCKTGILSADRDFYYSCRPKVPSPLSAGGATQYVGTYGRNPWIMLNTLGVQVNHNCLLGFILTTNASNASNVEYVVHYRFQVRGIA